MVIALSPTCILLYRRPLSRRLFDEEIKTKTLERYGNTIYNTKTGQIAGFVQSDILYNQYNFDPVVFAWNVDPMAAKFPHASPYSFVEGNPISRVDPDGNEWVNFHDRFVKHFTELALTSPNDKSIKRQLALHMKDQAEVNALINQIQTNDPALYNYIDKLSVSMLDKNGVEYQRNIKAIVSVDSRGSGNSNEAGSTAYYYDESGYPKAKRNGKELQVTQTPVYNISKGRAIADLGNFFITIYGTGSFRDATLANEAGDIMFHMEFNDLVDKQNSDNPSRDSYYKANSAGDYSRRVETKYKENKNIRVSEDNSYPLPLRDKK